MNQQKLDIWGYLLIGLLLTLLSYGGYISYKSIDWTVLQRLESQTLILPTPIISSVSASPKISTPSSVPR